MALGLLLRIFLTCFLLFDCGVGLPAEKERGYRYKAALLNRGDRNQAEALNSGVAGQRNWKDSNDQLLVPDHTSYNKPSGAQRPGSVPSLQNLPDTQRFEVERLVNGRPRDWSQDNPEQELVFPLSPNYPQRAPAEPQPGPVHTPYPPGSAGRPSNAAVPYSDDDYVSTGSPPSSQQQGSFTSKPTRVAARPFYAPRRGSPSSGFYRGEKPTFRPINYRPHTPVVSTRKGLNTRRVSEPIRRSYIVQSRNGFQRASFVQSNSRYSPEGRRGV